MSDEHAGSDNPFRSALAPLDKIDEKARQKPFTSDDGGASNPRKVAGLRKISDLKLVDRDILARTPGIADLTVHDLEDLASEFSGIPTSNARVSDLSIQDIQDIEAVFTDFKLSAGREMLAERAAATSVDVSCCCCTPCCCCAATDMSHTA